MDPLLTIGLEPNKRRLMPVLDYTGTLLLRWQISIPIPGIDPLQLRASIEAQQTIPIVGYLPRGQWEILGGNRLNSPLSEIDYTPLMEWFLITPSGFKTSQLLVYPYDQPTYQLPNIGSTVSFTALPQPLQTSNDSTNTSISAATGFLTISAANPNRIEGIIVNNSNKTLWVRFSSSLAGSSAPSLALPAGGNMDVPDQYVGNINGFIATGGAGVTGNINLTEFNAS